jgi:hypothetical protein
VKNDTNEETVKIISKTEDSIIIELQDSNCDNDDIRNKIHNTFFDKK